MWSSSRTFFNLLFCSAEVCRYKHFLLQEALGVGITEYWIFSSDSAHGESFQFEDWCAFSAL